MNINIIAFLVIIVVVIIASLFREPGYMKRGNAELDYMRDSYKRKHAEDMQDLGERTLKAYSRIDHLSQEQIDNVEGIAFILTGAEHTFLITERQLLALTNKENFPAVALRTRQEIKDWIEMNNLRMEVKESIGK